MARRVACRILIIGLALAAAEAPRGQPATPRTVARRAGAAFAWSPDGSYIAYAQGDTLAIAGATADFAERCRVRPSIAKPPIGEIAWSPDGRHLALVGPRSGDPIVDGWDTIWLTAADCAAARDLLPPSPIFGSPGVRRVALEGWLGANRLAFEMHVGPGAQRVDAVDTKSGAYASFCVMEAGLHWSPDRRRSIANLQRGAVGLVDAAHAAPLSASPDFCAASIDECEVVDGRPRGVAHEHEAWSPDGRLAILRRRTCLSPPLQPGPDDRLVVWDLAANRRTPLADHAARAAWSPDGARIAIVLFGTVSLDTAGRLVGGAIDAGAPPTLTLTIVDAASRRVRTSVPLGLVERIAPAAPPVLQMRAADDVRPAWSPDGRALLVRDAARSMRLIAADGGGDPLSFGDVRAMWSPAGRAIAMSDGRTMTIVRPE
jgi:WD40 repeat protein